MDKYDTMELKLLFPLHEEHRRAQQNFEQDESSSWDYTVQRIWLFRNNMSVQVLHAFIGYCRTGIDDD